MNIDNLLSRHARYNPDKLAFIYPFMGIIPPVRTVRMINFHLLSLKNPIFFTIDLRAQKTDPG